MARPEQIHRMLQRLLIQLFFAGAVFSGVAHGFDLLKESSQHARIVLLSPGDAAIRAAVDDLLSDLETIARHPVTPSLASQIIIGSTAELGGDIDDAIVNGRRPVLSGKWEAYRVFTHGDDLYILGSDTRGTMWGIYDFLETCLSCDPMYLWTDKQPQSRSEIVLHDVSLSSDGPAFKFRGWFINDEDFLTEWMPFDGRRNNDYKYYARIMHPDVADRIIETALRLRMNMIIPSSFNDVLNPQEAYAVNKAAERGLIVTQHHIEPLGVGGFNFDDYFEKQGKKAPLFSYLKNPEELTEVWDQYVEAWAAYPQVIWQLGLRGRGDRAIWNHDPSIPKDDAARGRIISDAIRYQYDLVRRHDPDGYMTLTLWLEMARLMEHGHLDIPDDITVIFADNSPGWGFSPDFYQVPREPNKRYGVYYHHQLWGTGPHFIQAIPPEKTHEVLAAAVANESDDYCMLNVGNIREFLFGLKLSSEMLFHWKEFDVERAKDRWFDVHYGRWSDEAQAVYEPFFAHYLLDTENRYSTGFTEMPNSPYILDGNLAWRMKQMLEDLNRHFGLEPFQGNSWLTAGERVSARKLSWKATEEDYLGQIRKQDAGALRVIESADALHGRMSGYSKGLLDTNLLTPTRMFHGLMACTIETMLAKKSAVAGDDAGTLKHLKNALREIQQANQVKQAMLLGQWQGWYRGEYKIMLSSYEEFLQHLIDGVE